MPPNPEGIKHAVATEIGNDRAEPQTFFFSLSRVLGSQAAREFLTEGWKAYFNGTPIPPSHFLSIDTTRQRVIRVSRTKPKPPCRWQSVKAIELCTCPSLTPEQADLRHVYECEHSEQDGVACTRGVNNGSAIYCADCSLYEARDSVQM
jgi:hypothetical protein